MKLDIFATVLAHRALHPRRCSASPRDEAWLEELLTQARASGTSATPRSSELSGGMMRRVLIAKALSHRPQVLFLDEPTAGVDVELRKGMWDIVRDLRAGGTTIILTTHYIEEAEAMADRIAVINGGRILLVEEKATLMRRMGRKHMTIELQCPVETIPESLAAYSLDARRRRPEPRVRLRHLGAAHRHHLAAARPLGRRPRAPRRADPAGLARGHLRRPGAESGHELARRLGDLPQRDGADLPHHPAEPRRAGDLDLALLRGLRHRDRLAHRGGRGHRVRRLHRARA